MSAIKVCCIAICRLLNIRIYHWSCGPDLLLKPDWPVWFLKNYLLVMKKAKFCRIWYSCNQPIKHYVVSHYNIIPIYLQYLGLYLLTSGCFWQVASQKSQIVFSVCVPSWMLGMIYRPTQNDLNNMFVFGHSVIWRYWLLVILLLNVNRSWEVVFKKLKICV